MITREEVIFKLEDYLKGKVSKAEIFSWALKIVTSPEYNNLDKKDKLLSNTIHVLFDLHHGDSEIEFDPSREELIYYKECLEGKRKVDILEAR